MKKIFLLFTFIVCGIIVKAQSTDLSNPTTSVVLPVTYLGGTGFVEVQLSNTWYSIPAYGVRLEITITHHLNITPVLVDNFGVWGVTYVGTENGNTVIAVKNTLGAMPVLSNYELRFNFVAAVVDCLNCGLVNSNVGLTDDAIGLSDVPANNNSANALFTVAQPLPIKLGDFDATVNECSSIDVSWNTYSEENFDRAEIERSFNGKDFTTIGTVKSKGNGSAVNNVYKFKDSDQLKKGTVYYRLKTIDNDKTFSYSKVVTAEVNCEAGAEIDIFPNPTRGITNVKFSGLKFGGVRDVMILNSKGDAIKKVSMDVETVNSLNVTGLPSGVYILKLIDDTNVIQKKFVKIN